MFRRIHCHPAHSILARDTFSLSVERLVLLRRTSHLHRVISRDHMFIHFIGAIVGEPFTSNEDRGNEQLAISGECHSVLYTKDKTRNCASLIYRDET